MEHDLVSIKEAADMLNITAGHLHYYIREGRMPEAVKIGKTIAFHRTDIENFKFEDKRRIKKKDRMPATQHSHA